MSDLTPQELKDTLRLFAGILHRQSEHIERLTQDNAGLRGRLEALMWDNRYSQHFNTEFDATVTYNLLHHKRDPDAEPVARLPKHLQEPQHPSQTTQLGVHELYENEE